MGEPSGQGEQASAQGLGGRHRLSQTDASNPAGQVVSHHLYCHPGGVGRKASRGQMIQRDTVLEVLDGVLDLGVAAMIGLQLEGVAQSVGDEGVIARAD